MQGSEGHIPQKEKRRREKERVGRGDIKKGAVLCNPVFPRPLHHAQGSQWQHGSRSRKTGLQRPHMKRAWVTRQQQGRQEKCGQEKQGHHQDH